MNVKRDLIDDYEDRCEVLRDLGPVAERLVQELLTAADLRVHSVRHRIKSKESVQRKTSRKEGGYGGLEEMHDLLGLRVITFFPDEVDQVAEVIESEFVIDDDNSVDKRTLLDPDRFGYLSRHYVVGLSDKRSQLTEHSRFAGFRFEIQIRSILQHAWAEIEHDLGYHNTKAIPTRVRRRFFRLAGLLEIADDEFQALREEVAEYQVAVKEEIGESPESVQLDQDSLIALLKGSSVGQELDRYIAKALQVPLDPTRFTAAGSLAADLREVGLETVGQVTDALLKQGDVVKAFVDRWVKHSRPRPGSSEVGAGISLFYLAYVLVGESGDINRIVSYLTAVNIGPGDFETPERLAQYVLDTWTDANASIS